MKDIPMKRIASLTFAFLLSTQALLARDDINLTPFAQAQNRISSNSYNPHNQLSGSTRNILFEYEKKWGTAGAKNYAKTSLKGKVYSDFLHELFNDTRKAQDAVEREVTQNKFKYRASNTLPGYNATAATLLKCLQWVGSSPMHCNKPSVCFQAVSGRQID